MKRKSVLMLLTIACLAAAPALVPADDASLQAVCKFLQDNDKEVRAIGLEQVRDGLAGAEATQRFVALLPQLAPKAQQGLILALGDRGDKTALAAVRKFIASDVPGIRSAAILAVGALGNQDEAATLVPLLGKPECQQDAGAAILCLQGQGIPQALLAQTKQAPPLRAQVFPLLVKLNAVETVPELVAAADDADKAVREAALAALSQLAGPEQIGDLGLLLLKAESPADREAVERAMTLLRERSGKPDVCAKPLLALMQSQGPKEKGLLFSALGHIGGKQARNMVFAGLADADPAVRQVALQALCNWPDGTVAPKLVEVAKQDEDPAHRKMAVDALIRVAPLPNDRKRPDGNRSDKERLEMMKKAMELATTKDQKITLLYRAGAVYTIDTLQFVLPYLDQREFVEAAATAIVTIAHHKEVRHAYPKEFDDALGRVIKASKNKGTIDRAQRYKEDRT